MVEPSSDGPPRWLLITGVAVAVVAVAAVLVLAASHRTSDERPLVIPAAPAPQASSPQCQALLDALPQQLGGYRRATADDPVPPATAAWRSGSGGEPVILRCGLDRPDDFVIGSPIQVVDDVQWYRADSPDNSLTTWFTVDRPVYIALTLPQGSGPTPIQQLSDVVSAKISAVPIRPGPPR